MITTISGDLGMEPATFATIFAGVALLLNLGQRVFGGGWNLQKNLANIEGNLKESIEESRKVFDDKQQIAAHTFGETVTALKEHVRQVEFHVRDNYIRKDDFVVHMKAHDDLLRANFANLHSRLERIEKRLDANG